MCKSLENKPKLFFFQACRGDHEIEIARSKSRPDSAESNSSGETTLDDQHQRDYTSVSDGPNTNKKTLSYVESDLLVYNATIPKHYAYGTETDGTYFIQSVCKVLFEKAYRHLPNNLPLSQMITMINSKVQEKKQDTQVAESIYRLKKEVFFTPKNVSCHLCI